MVNRPIQHREPVKPAKPALIEGLESTFGLLRTALEGTIIVAQAVSLVPNFGGSKERVGVGLTKPEGQISSFGSSPERGG